MPCWGPLVNSSNRWRRRSARDVRHTSCRSGEEGALASDSEQTPWMVDRGRRPYCIRVELPKRTFVLPWAQFLYAEGAADAVRAVFSVHDVVITGCGLEGLLAELAAQAVTVIRQPGRAESFPAASGPRVVAVDVRRIEGSGRSIER